MIYCVDLRALVVLGASTPARSHTSSGYRPYLFIGTAPFSPRTGSLWLIGG